MAKHAEQHAIEAMARELRDAIDQQHAERIGAVLGCRVTVLRREPLGRHLDVPVFGMPAEFLSEAETLGLKAEAL
jgi:hypothetical protein